MAARRRIQRTKNDQYIVTLPKALVEALGVEKGTEVEFTISGENELKLRIAHEKKR